jgi:SAM-dependent methyltransferase
MDYIYSLPTSVSFTGKGLLGYAFGPLKQKDLAIDYVEVERGHDTFMISNKITRHYYILSGSGHFTINDRIYPVGPGVLVEVPPKVEYSYSGKMKLILFQSGRWFPGSDTHTKWNPDVVKGDFPCAVDGGSWLTRLVKLRIFGKSPLSAYLRLNRRLWNALPASFTTLGPIRSYGNLLHTLVRIEGVRGQLFHTYFLRNRVALDLIRRLVQRSLTDTLRVAVLGCSTGAEAYSVAWKIRSARPDLKLIFQAVDISPQAVEVARSGVYSLTVPQITNKNIFDRVSGAEIEELFDKDGDVVRVKSWIKEGIEWHVGDVGDPEIRDALGQQDIVVANNFLCHMDAAAADRCLRNIARLVKPRGYLFVSGIDLDVRTKIARELGWNAIQESLEEMHEEDPNRCYWPWHYSALEPLNKKRKDWRLRYAAAFQVARSGESAHNAEGDPSRRGCREVLLPEHGCVTV